MSSTAGFGEGEIPQRALAVMTVATNRYVRYWMELAVSFDRLVSCFSAVRLYVFTNEPKEVQAFATQLERVSVVPVEIPDLTWPDATLQRYQLISEISGNLRESVLAHVDADMRVVRDFPTILANPEEWSGELALVRHPAFPAGKAKGHGSWARNQFRRARGVSARLQIGGHGAWETRKESNAYVPRRKRQTYVCGGVWFGSRDALVSMCKDLAEHVEEDRQRGITARWHDESHLNWYAAMNEVTLLGSEFCVPEGFRLVGPEKPVLVAVDKGVDRTR